MPHVALIYAMRCQGCLSIDFQILEDFNVYLNNVRNKNRCYTHAHKMGKIRSLDTELSFFKSAYEIRKVTDCE